MSIILQFHHYNYFVTYENLPSIYTHASEIIKISNFTAHEQTEKQMHYNYKGMCSTVFWPISRQLSKCSNNVLFVPVVQMQVFKHQAVLRHVQINLKCLIVNNPIGISINVIRKFHCNFHASISIQIMNGNIMYSSSYIRGDYNLQSFADQLNTCSG